MSLGALLLTVAAILVFCGLLQRVLDRMYLTDRQALWIIAAMLAGTFLPPLHLGRVSMGLGGGLIPLGVCAYVFARAQAAERVRALICTVLTGVAICILTRLWPAEAEEMLFDPLWLYGLVAGVISWGISRSRRGAFISAVGGVVLADIITALTMWRQGTEVDLVLGGAGIADAIVVSGVSAVFACEVLGELVERLSNRFRREGNRA